MRFSLALTSAAALLTVEVDAFRVRPKRKSQKVEGAAGIVDELYTYGAPSTAKPPMRNPLRSDGCFPGLRMWSSRHGAASFGRDQVDFVAPLANIVGYRHPFMDGMELEVGEGKQISFPCSEENTNGPPGKGEGPLHEREIYLAEGRKLDALAKNVTEIGMIVSYMRDEQEAARHVNSFGWGLVHSAYHPGGILVGGPQVSHLLQDPDSLTCMVTFQGTDTLKDWLADAVAISVDFCGMPLQVHKGFRDHLRRIVKSDVFQTKIRPYLGSCSKVIATGHSLGAAMAELLTGCLATAPAAGTKGWNEDYQYMNWNHSRASKLTYVQA